MQKEKPLWERLYFDEAYVEIARLIGYRGTTYRAMTEMLEPLERKLGKQRVQSATYHIVTFEGKMTCNPKPLAEVTLRPEIRRLCWQLLGPPPESVEAFNRQPLTPSNDERPTTRKQPPARKTRKKNAESPKPKEKDAGKPTHANSAATRSSAMIAQYQAAKEKHPDMMLLFRIGDCFELFDQDAEIAQKVLGLTITAHDHAKMANFSHHRLEGYLHELLKAGHRVGICDIEVGT